MATAIAGAVSPWVAAAEGDAVFLRAVNLNGPPLSIAGNGWDAESEARDFKASGNRFENQNVMLAPPVDDARAQMIRSSVWGNDVTFEFAALPDGLLQVFLYVWEDNNNEQFDLVVNGEVVMEKFHSGTTGMWKRLGPWHARADGGRLTVGAKGPGHGAANLSGVEVWQGEGAVPDPALAGFVHDPTPEQLEFFEKRVRPVLAENCYKCHSAEAEKLKGGLLLDSRAGVRKGGDTGAVVVAGDPDASLLVRAIRRIDPDLSMPPKNPLPPEAVAALEEWIRMGAPDPRAEDTVAIVAARESIDWEKAREWWAFRPLDSPAPPEVRDAAWPVTEIDRFVLANIEAAGLEPAPDAGRRALIRRATYDLTGLPPTPDEVADFLADEAPDRDAFARVVDRLLASPRYGERWGRHWLDVVRYADTAGDNSDYPVPQIHRYRDWVIDAFNRDLPYDEFVRDQLAGDLRDSNSDEQRFERIVATGYIANARRFGSRVDDYPQHLTIEDTLDSIGRSFLGLTVSCARCHDHKFDPVTTKDYYALYGIFDSTRYPWPGIELDKRQRDFVPLVPSDQVDDAEARKRAFDEEENKLSKEIDDLRKKAKDANDDEKAKAEEALKAAEQRLADHRAAGLPFEFAYAVADRPADKIRDVPVQEKGDPAKPGEIVPRRFLKIFGGEPLPQETAASASGRRELAEWIVAEGNPLPARVMANRIWHYHFGRGIVSTPNDFGKQGKPPTHPELLDWLAIQFREGGWSVKNMHRLIMLSRVYRIASFRSGEAIERDPNNELLTAFPRRRLDAESIRDTLLALGENLDLSPPEPHPFPPEHAWDFTQHNPFKAVYETNRRSVYLMTQRIQRHPFLAIFDGADPSASTPARTSSTTPLQALFLLNDPFVHEQANRVADRIVGAASDDSDRIKLAFELLFARAPSDDEIAAALDFLSTARAQLAEAGVSADDAGSESWRAFTRSLFRANEFVYVD